jgi:hypothetical protein
VRSCTDPTKEIIMATKATTKQATGKKPAVPKAQKVPARQAAKVVLLEANRPMHYREITKKALEAGIVKVRGGKGKPNPEATMKTIRSYLAGCAAEGVEFVRVDAGVFAIKESPAKKVAAKKKAAAAKAPAKVAAKPAVKRTAAKKPAAKAKAAA